MSEILPTINDLKVLLPESPYKGLVPYEEKDAAFFFGRESERENIIANLRAWKLSLLYGPSGVGKSSMLRAGVVHHLHQLARFNLAQDEQASPEVVAVIFSTWRDDPVAGLIRQIEETVKQIWPEREFSPGSDLSNLALVLREWVERLDSQLYLILDQFEEYFLYHSGEEGEGTFIYEFSRAVNQLTLGVSFLIAIREDELAKLDRLKKRIPSLFDHLLRLDHLNREAASFAILNPLKEYNRRQEMGKPPVVIERELVDTLLNELLPGRVGLGEAGRGGVIRKSEDSKKVLIETPYLQLVLNQLWEAERKENPIMLRLLTLKRLGGAIQIARTHLDSVMNRQPAKEQEISATIFRYLVTPSGGKIALSVSDLVDYTKIPAKELILVLENLASSNLRILRPISSSLNEPKRYEIYLDVLAPAILDWRHRYELDVQARLAKEEAEKQAASAKEEAEKQAASAKIAQREAQVKEREERVARQEAERQAANAKDAELEAIRAKEEAEKQAQSAREKTKTVIQAILFILIIFVVSILGISLKNSEDQKESANVQLTVQAQANLEKNAKLTAQAQTILESKARATAESNAHTLKDKLIADGLKLVNEGKWDEAISTLEQVYDVDKDIGPRLITAYVGKISDLIRQGNYSNALEQCNSATRKVSGDLGSLKNICDQIALVVNCENSFSGLLNEFSAKAACDEARKRVQDLIK